ncbi:PaaI family thioesterase [Corynebacterium bovis]|uniref:PaaI family thioesterase n=1 Tax=Corynebacterium bovis TaxID=36808 RepID=UPI00254BE819|nr:PaaI family thioesterase [Corynebacterium bovis]MDK8509944.1 PaaI family thioesterase [Corynebacterium bovis]
MSDGRSGGTGDGRSDGHGDGRSDGPGAGRGAGTGGGRGDGMRRYGELMALAAERVLDAAERDEVDRLTSTGGGLDATLGTRYVEVGPGRVVVRLAVTDRHLQPWGVTNGGVYCSLGESTASIASFIAAGAEAPVMGIVNETQFLRPSVAGDVIVSTAVPVHLGRTSHLWRVEHVNEATGKMCAVTQLRTTVLVDGARGRR